MKNKDEVPKCPGCKKVLLHCSCERNSLKK